MATQEINWWHQIELPDGTVTPGHDQSAAKLESLHLPSLAGKSVLDVGALDGYFSFAAERLGAARVLATDSYMWQQPGGRNGFEYARSALGSKVEDREIDVLDLSPEAVGTFDVVFFLGVLYHMRHPLLALERVASVTRELCVVETLTDLTFLRRPAAAFYPGRTMGDATNWWAPNRAGLLGLLREAGFQRVEVFTRNRVARLAKNAPSHAKGVASGHRGSKLTLVRDFARHALARDRMVVHAYK